MCGIVGLYLKNPRLEPQLGQLFEPMLQAMTDRGPDSAGFAIYGDEVADGWVKLTLQATTEAFDWKGLMGELEGRIGCSLDWFQNASAAVLKIHADEALVRQALGVTLPLQGLAWWVVGNPRPGAAHQARADADGRLALLNQDGWRIEFSRYVQSGRYMLPGKLVARRADDLEIRLVVDEWETDRGAP